LLAVDVGNSTVKLGCFRFDDESRTPEPIDVVRVDTRSPDFAAVKRWLPQEPAVCYLCSVHRWAAEQTRQWLLNQVEVLAVHGLRRTDFPLSARVRRPEQVGHDRLASAAAAASVKSHERPAIVVDAGSAMTVDVISRQGDLLGGAILPGLQASARALSTETDLLPQVGTAHWDSLPPAVGDSTEAAIHSGVFWGAVGAIRGLVDRMKSQIGGDAEVILTGGDMRHMAEHVDPQAAYRPYLVLTGIVLAARQRQSTVTPV
jgi:type III pantothenate kinase